MIKGLEPLTSDGMVRELALFKVKKSQGFVLPMGKTGAKFFSVAPSDRRRTNGNKLK